MIRIVFVCDAMYIANDDIFVIIESPYVVYMYNMYLL